MQTVVVIEITTSLEIINTVTITSSNIIRTMVKGKTFTRIIRRITEKTFPREGSLDITVEDTISLSRIGTPLNTNIETPLKMKSTTTTSSNTGTTVTLTIAGILVVTIILLIGTGLVVDHHLITQTRVVREVVVETSRTGRLTRIGIKKIEFAFSGSEFNEFQNLTLALQIKKMDML